MSKRKRTSRKNRPKPLNRNDPPSGPVTQHVKAGEPLTPTGQRILDNSKVLHFPARPKPSPPLPPPPPAFRFHPDYDAGRLIIFPGDEFSDFTITCWRCGTRFADPPEWTDRLQSGHAMTICPKRTCHAILQVIPDAH